MFIQCKYRRGKNNSHTSEIRTFFPSRDLPEIAEINLEHQEGYTDFSGVDLDKMFQELDEVVRNDT